MKIPGSNDFGGFYKNTLPENRKERDITKSKGRGMEGNGGKKEKGLIKEHVWLTPGHGHGQQYGDWLWEPRGGLGRGGQRGENWYNSNRINKNKKRGQCHYDTRTSKKIYTKGKLQTSSPPGRVSKNSKQNVANQILFTKYFIKDKSLIYHKGHFLSLQHLKTHTAYKYFES